MKRFKKTQVCCVVCAVVMIFAILSGISCVRLYAEKRLNEILALQSSVFYMKTVMLRVEEDEAWEGAAAALEVQTFLFNGIDDVGDNRTVKAMMQAVSRVSGDAENRQEIMEELDNLRISWDTRPWHWTCDILSGNVEKIFDLALPPEK